jgi:hypothetical protein
MSAARRDAERQFNAAFAEVLRQVPTIRHVWLVYLRARQPDGGTPVPIEPADEAGVARLEAQLRGRSAGYQTWQILNLLMLSLHFDAPMLLEGYPFSVHRYLADLAREWAAGRFPDPLTPWAPRGRPRHTPADRQRLRERVIWLIQHCDARQWKPTQTRVADLLQNSDEDPAPSATRQERSADSVVRAIKRLGSWTSLLAEARARKVQE